VPGVAAIVSHWSRERATLRQGFLALGLCVAVTLVAGIVLGSVEVLLENLPGLVVLIPPAIGMRGAIFGSLAARLGTEMLTGQFRLPPGRRSPTGQNIEAAVLLSVATAALLAVLARAATGVLGQESISVAALGLISLVGALLSSAVVLAVVLALARTAQRRSWDMDSIGTPTVTATADLSALPALVVGALLVRNEVVTAVLGGLALAAGLAAALVGLRHRRPVTRRVVRQSLPILFYTAAMGVLAGTVVEARLDSLEPGLLIAVPPFIAASGAIGGILSARLSSRLHLGLISTRGVPEGPAFLEASTSLLLGVAGFTAVGLLSGLAAAVTGLASPGLASLTGSTLLGGLLAVGVVFPVSYYAAAASFRFGLDPDNIGIPTVTSSMDFFGVLCLVVGINAFAGV
jgi:mgtE-like transporter